jgi:hypothetical protein
MNFPHGLVIFGSFLPDHRLCSSAAAAFPRSHRNNAFDQ